MKNKQKIKFENKEFFMSRLDPSYKLKIPFKKQPYVCLIITLNKINDNIQNKIAKFIINSKCKYVMCTGKNCSELHDKIDLAYIDKYKDDFSDKNFIMTTWHEDERIEDILFYFFNLTNHPYCKFNKYLILFIGKNKTLKNKYLKEVKKIISKNE